MAERASGASNLYEHPPLAGGSQHLDAQAMGILLACCAAWGVNQVAIKISNSGITPILGAGLRWWRRCS